jgi:hypothetical protein
MIMESLDLNIHNYNLTDLLTLFKLPYNFSEIHLKEAKKIVLKTHPDKSGLEPEYFLFFSQAYKYLLNIHQLRQSGTTKNTDYHTDDIWSKEHSILIDGKIKTMNQEEYNRWFNDTFEKMRVKDEADSFGYGEWLKSNDDIVSKSVQNSREMNEYIQGKKKDLRAVVVHRDFNDLSQSNIGQFDLVRDTPDNYGSGIFNKLQYEDLKKAHVESVVPVTDDDFHSRKKYKNMDELNRDRTRDNIRSDKEWMMDHQEKIKERHTHDDNINIQRAYKLMNQDEHIRNNYTKFWSDLKRIQH